MANLDLSADIIDVRDIIERIDELEEEIKKYKEEFFGIGKIGIGFDDIYSNHDNEEELKTLQDIMDDLLEIGGGDEKWRGHWYPLTLINDSYFTTYTQELLEDCGDLPKDLPDYIEIDWEKTARNIRVDYTSIEIEGLTYWTR